MLDMQLLQQRLLELRIERQRERENVAQRDQRQVALQQIAELARDFSLALQPLRRLFDQRLPPAVGTRLVLDRRLTHRLAAGNAVELVRRRFLENADASDAAQQDVVASILELVLGENASQT